MSALEQRLRDYATNGCRSWAGIEAVFLDAANALKVKDDALRPFAEAANEAEPYGEYAHVSIANTVTMADCLAARLALSPT